MEAKTNVLRLLDKQKIKYEFVEYEMKDEYSAADIARNLGLTYAEVFKTLVLVGKSNKNYVFVVSSDKELDLKKAAKVVDEKSLDMVKSKMLLELTGYIHGGCSPIGMKKTYVTIVDKTAEGCDNIYVNGGRRGLMIKIKPSDLQNVVAFSYAQITIG